MQHRELITQLEAVFGANSAVSGSSGGGFGGADSVRMKDVDQDEEVRVSLSASVRHTGLGAAEVRSLSECVLCPIAEVVRLTAKPGILAASQGPLGQYFSVPQYMALKLPADEEEEFLSSGGASRAHEPSCLFCNSSFDTSLRGGQEVDEQEEEEYARLQADRSVSLQEVKMFAESVGYPVLLKGPQQGALLCTSWLMLQQNLLTCRWAQGGFVQRRMLGWEKCLAFAAVEGELTGMVYAFVLFLVLLHFPSVLIDGHSYCFL
jgi:hypothetical protein